MFGSSHSSIHDQPGVLAKPVHQFVGDVVLVAASSRAKSALMRCVSISSRWIRRRAV
jgi:hypothetical protein